MRTTGIGALVGLGLVLGVCCPAGAMWADLPVPVMVNQSDLIAVVSLVKAGEVAAAARAVPDLNFTTAEAVPLDKVQPRDGHWRTFTVRIEKIYRDTSGKLKVGDQVEAMAPAPPPQPAQPNVVVADGPFYPVIQQGQSCLVMLRSMGPGKGYFLPGYPKSITPAGQIDQRLEAGAAELLDIEKWGWGKAEAGLQMAAIVRQPIIALTGRNPRTGRQVTSLQVLLAVRNASDKPITLTLDAQLKPLAVKVTTAAGTAVKEDLDLYAGVKESDPRSKTPVTLAPGQIVFVSPWGSAASYQYLQSSLAAGKYKLTASYTVDRARLPAAEEADKDKPAPWSGRLESAPADFQVQRNPREKPTGPT